MMPRMSMAILISLTLLLVIMWALFTCVTPRAADRGEIHGILTPGMVNVTDGDTFEFIQSDEYKGLIIRLHGADAPEKRQICLHRHGGTIPCANDAKEELQRLLQSGEFHCLYISKSYERLVMQCTVDGRDIGYHMVRKGLAFHDGRYTKDIYKAKLTYAQAMAWAEDRGVWQQEHVETAMDWRYRNKGGK